jgi:hypothetical protein
MRNRDDGGGLHLRNATLKSERPAPVPGHALGVLYSGLHGTVWSTRQVRTTGVSPPFEPVQIGQRHICAKQPPWQRASRDKSGHLRNLRPKLGWNFAGMVLNDAFAK